MEARRQQVNDSADWLHGSLAPSGPLDIAIAVIIHVSHEHPPGFAEEMAYAISRDIEFPNASMPRLRNKSIDEVSPLRKIHTRTTTSLALTLHILSQHATGPDLYKLPRNLFVVSAH
jgi:hypothetical protein